MTLSAAAAALATGPAAGSGGTGGRRHGRNRIFASASVEAVAGPGGVTRLPVLASQVPLVLRRTPSAVYLVGGAAGPIGGDRLDLRIVVGAGAFLRVRTAAASIALPGLDGLESQLRVTVTVGAGGRLEYLPEPVVVTAGARHATLVSVTLAAGASLLLRDELLLGRHGEDGGTARSVLRADYDGRPLLRHSVEVCGSDAVSRGPALLAGHRGFGTLLRAGRPDVGDAAAGKADGAWSADGWDAARADAARADAARADAGAAGADSTGAGPGRGSGSGSSAGSASGFSAVGAAGRAAERSSPGAVRRAAGQPAVAVLPLAGPGELTTALADDAVTLRRLLGGS